MIMIMVINISASPVNDGYPAVSHHDHGSPSSVVTLRGSYGRC